MMEVIHVIAIGKIHYMTKTDLESPFSKFVAVMIKCVLKYFMQSQKT